MLGRAGSADLRPVRRRPERVPRPRRDHELPAPARRPARPPPALQGRAADPPAVRGRAQGYVFSNSELERIFSNSNFFLNCPNLF